MTRVTWRSALFKYNNRFFGASMLNISFLLLFTRYFQAICAFLYKHSAGDSSFVLNNVPKEILLLQVKQKPTFHFVGRVGFLRWDLKWKKVHRILYSLQACCCGKNYRNSHARGIFVLGLNPFIIFIITGTDFGFG